MRELAEASRVAYTTLARFLIYQGAERTLSLRRKTLNAVAVVLDVRAEWIRDGQGEQQLGFWPILTPADAETELVEPPEQMRVVLDSLSRVADKSLQLRAYRAAVAAILGAIADAGHIMPPEAYRSLMRLDALQRQPRLRAVAL